MEEYLKLVSYYGFPVVVAGYLLWRMNGKLQNLCNALNRNTKAILLLLRDSGKFQEEIEELLK